MTDPSPRERTPGQARGQVVAVALVGLLSGLLVGFVVVAVADGGGRTGGGADAAGDPLRRPAEWRRVSSSSGRYTVELPGRPIDDVGAITLGVGRSVPIATRHVTTADGTTTIAELDYSAMAGTDGYDLRLGAAGAVMRAGGSLRRFDEVASPLGRAASFSGGGAGVEVQGFLVAHGAEVVLLLVTSPSSGADSAAGAILRMASTLSRA